MAQPTVEQDLDALEKAQAKLEEKLKKFTNIINNDFYQLDDVIKDLAKQRKAFKELKTRLAAESKAQPKKPATPEDPIKQRLYTVSKSIETVHKAAVPETGSLFVRLWLGQVNVKAYRDSERTILKLEYEKFKQRTNIVFLVFVILQLYIISKVQFFEILFHVWLLYYYTSLALRENILRVNGSNIKSWWIIHHYLSIVVSLTLIMFPQDAYDYFYNVLLYFQLVQAAVQFLMNRYQSRQLYKQIALGVADRMDVTGEAVEGSIFTSWAPTAMFLLPFLLCFQVSQLFIANWLFQYFFAGHYQWQVLTGAVIFVVLGFGNLGTTIYTYYRNGLFGNSVPRRGSAQPVLNSVAGADLSASSGPTKKTT